MVRLIICSSIRNRSTAPALKFLRAKPCSPSLLPFHSNENMVETHPLINHVYPIRSLSTTTRQTGNSNATVENKPKESTAPKSAIKIVEVGPRDGLQNEPLPLVSIQDKIEFIRRLEKAGCSNIEVGAFVSPKWIPQMSGSAEVLSGLLEMQETAGLAHDPGANAFNNIRSNYSILIPNTKGLEQALSVETDSIQKDGRTIDEIAIFGAASEEFTKKNINSTIEESMNRFRDILDRVREVQQNTQDNGQDRPPLLVRGYVSTVIACPYQGVIKPKKVAEVVEKMLELGCHEVSLGDTIGVGTPESTKRMLEEVLNVAKPPQLAMHYHDTYGQALVNILTGLEKEIYTIDSSVAGLGGCPYAKGASGNVATEDVLYMLHGMGLSTGIDLEKLFDAGRFICQVLDRQTLSKVARALASDV